MYFYLKFFVMNNQKAINYDIPQMEKTLEKYSKLKAASWHALKELDTLLPKYRKLAKDLKSNWGASSQKANNSQEAKAAALAAAHKLAPVVKSLKEKIDQLLLGPIDYPYALPKGLSLEDKVDELARRNKKWFYNLKDTQYHLKLAKEQKEEELKALNLHVAQAEELKEAVKTKRREMQGEFAELMKEIEA
jgi:predicted  nucleic acid-binding Zn-ribbon protein